MYKFHGIIILNYCIPVFFFCNANFSESDKQKPGEYVKDKLDDALRKKVDEIEEKRK